MKKSFLLSAFLTASLFPKATFAMMGGETNFDRDYYKTYQHLSPTQYTDVWEIDHLKVQPAHALPNNCSFNFMENQDVIINPTLLIAINERSDKTFVCNGKCYQMADIEIPDNHYLMNPENVLVCHPMGKDRWFMDHMGLKFTINKIESSNTNNRLGDDLYQEDQQGRNKKSRKQAFDMDVI